ncbi:hypothetical protein I6J42_31790 [Streptomyces californicus]|uniref:Phenylacetate-CoA ligase n=2 Tax=Streptomyces TaxID=1883 RepID=A0ABD7D680_9ACTN|nr:MULTISPECIES: hypothetical protein [Streptomyces]QRV31843.1 hypothetical protein I6J39_01965 [Streptomyces californicus]QRV38994.1 hypothetical protein I6J42_31790 [Streptomyces californicus]QRV45257.1 hypothetical protein I6J41_01795 [Streptomyces californicus]QRV51947.1 hypothetical protein I6J43_01835 [Streptomyces californicus]
MMVRPTDEVIDHIRDIPIYQESLANGCFPVLDKTEIARGFPDNWMTPRLAAALRNGEAEFVLSTGTNHARMRIIRPPYFLLRSYYALWRDHPDIGRTWESGCPRLSLTTVLATEHVARVNAARRGAEPGRPPTPADRRLDERTSYLNLRLDPARWTREDVLRMLGEIDLARSAHPRGEYHLDCSGYHLAHLVRKVEAWGLENAFPEPASIVHAYEYTPVNVRRFLHRRFACPVIDLYGSTELGYLFYSDREGRYWPHLDRMSVELLPAAPGGAIHQLIVTSVRNPHMPLVRYRTGDCVRTLDGTPDPGKIVQFCGRLKELLTTPDGPVAQGDLDRHIAAATPRIFLHQLRLHGDTEATLLYTTFTGEPLGAAETESLRRSTGELTGRNCRIEHRARIPIGPSGKYAWLTADRA